MGATFLGHNDQLIGSGSNCGHLFVWEKSSARILLIEEGDLNGTVNFVAQHPHQAKLVSCGMDDQVEYIARG